MADREELLKRAMLIQRAQALKAAQDRQSAPDTNQGQAFLEGYGQGATFGYLPQIQAGVAPAQDWAMEQIAKSDFGARLMGVPQGATVDSGDYLQRRDENIARQERLARENPATYAAGNVLGAVATTAMAAPLATTGRGAQAASALDRVKGAAKAGAAFGALANPGDKEGEISPVQARERIINAIKGAAIGGALGAGTEVAASGLKAGANVSKKAIKKLQDFVVKEKPDADEIRAAAKALGFEATPGMVTDSQTIQKLESSLSQSPSIPGAIVRKSQRKAADALEKAGRELTEDASQLTRYEAGDLAKRQIKENVEKRFLSPKKSFQDLRNYTKDISSTEKSVASVIRNINKIDEVATFQDGAAASVAKSVNNVLRNRPSADQIKKLRTMVGKKASAAARAGDGEEAGIWKIYQKLGRLEENTIKRGVLDSARTGKEAETITQGMLGKLRSAKKDYSEQMRILEDAAKAGKIKVAKSPNLFAEKVDDIDAEKIGNKFFNLADAKGRRVTKETFPEAFQTLRKQRLSEIRDKSMSKGKLDPGKLIRQVDKMDDEAVRDLFRDSIGTTKNMKKVMDSFPDKVGPSGTPEGIVYSSLFDIATKQVTDFGRLAAYKGITQAGKITNALARRLKKLSEFKSLSERNPKKFNLIVGQFSRTLEGAGKGFDLVAEDERRQERGKSKWAQKGLDKIKQNSSPEKRRRFEQMTDELLKSKKGKDLLSQISTLKPGTKAYENAVNRLEKMGDK